MQLLRSIKTKPPRLRFSVATLSSATLRFGERTESSAHLPQALLLIGGPDSNTPSLAREIHTAGVRRDKPFMRLSCNSLPTRSGFDRLMFGSLTGISTESSNKRGALRSIGGGTLFLGDVNLLPDQSQHDLFAALDAHQVVPLGAHEAVAIDVRIMASVDAFLMDRDSEECVLVRMPICVLAEYLTELPALRAGSIARGNLEQS